MTCLLYCFSQDYKYYDVPPYSEQFNKQAMINYFEKQFACQQDDFETCEMDLDASENGMKEKRIDNQQVSVNNYECSINEAD